AHISERRLCKAGPEVAVPQRPSSVLLAPAPIQESAAPGSVAAPVAPALIPAPALPAAPAAPDASASSLVTQPASTATNVAVADPTAVPPYAAPAVPPDLFDVGRKLQRELLRVGCGAVGIETNGIWGTASREALRSFNERTRSVAVIDRPTPEALEAVRSQKARACPVTPEPRTELRAGAS